jgi:hypothetical protein
MALHKLAMLTTPIPMPKYPRFFWITFFVPALQHSMKSLRHRNFSWSQMATLLFPGVQDDIAVVQIDILPLEPVRFADSGHGFTNHQSKSCSSGSATAITLSMSSTGGTYLIFFSTGKNSSPSAGLLEMYFFLMPKLTVALK